MDGKIFVPPDTQPQNSIRGDDVNGARFKMWFVKNSRASKDIHGDSEIRFSSDTERQALYKLQSVLLAHIATRFKSISKGCSNGNSTDLATLQRVYDKFRLHVAHSVVLNISIVQRLRMEEATGLAVSDAQINNGTPPSMAWVQDTIFKLGLLADKLLLRWAPRKRGTHREMGTTLNVRPKTERLLELNQKNGTPEELQLAPTNFVDIVPSSHCRDWLYDVRRQLLDLLPMKFLELGDSDMPLKDSDWDPANVTIPLDTELHDRWDRFEFSLRPVIINSISGSRKVYIVQMQWADDIAAGKNVPEVYSKEQQRMDIETTYAEEKILPDDGSSYSLVSSNDDESDDIDSSLNSEFGDGWILLQGDTEKSIEATKKAATKAAKTEKKAAILSERASQTARQTCEASQTNSRPIRYIPGAARTGDKFSLSTLNPIKHPVPKLELMQMQHSVHHILGRLRQREVLADLFSGAVDLDAFEEVDLGEKKRSLSDLPHIFKVLLDAAIDKEVLLPQEAAWWKRLCAQDIYREWESVDMQ